MLIFHAVIAAMMVLLGAAILVEMIAAAGTGGFAILPGVVLGAAMLLLGLHRLRLVARVWGTR